MEASSYEDAISFGGDSDTPGAIAGGIAGARFSIPHDSAAEGWRRLPDDTRGVLEALYRSAGEPFPWIPRKLAGAESPS